MADSLTGFIDRYMPPKIRNTAQLSIEEQVHCRVYIAINLLTILLCVLDFAVFGLVNIFTDYDMSMTMIFAAVSFVMGCSLYYVFYQSGQIRAAAMLYTTMFVVVVFTCIAISGGARSALMPVLISSPVIAAVMGGRHEGIYNSLVVLFLGGVLVVLDSAGFEFLQTVPVANFNLLYGASWVITIVLNVTCLAAYQYFYEKAHGIKSTRPALR